MPARSTREHCSSAESSRRSSLLLLLLTTHVRKLFTAFVLMGLVAWDNVFIRMNARHFAAKTN